MFFLIASSNILCLLCECSSNFYWNRMHQMGHSFCFMLVLTIQLEWILQKNNGERSHNSSRFAFCDGDACYFLNYCSKNNRDTYYFRSRGTLPSSIWHIKVLLVVIRRGMQSLLEFFWRMAI